MELYWNTQTAIPELTRGGAGPGLTAVCVLWSRGGEGAPGLCCDSKGSTGQRFLRGTVLHGAGTVPQETYRTHVRYLGHIYSVVFVSQV